MNVNKGKWVDPLNRKYSVGYYHSNCHGYFFKDKKSIK